MIDERYKQYFTIVSLYHRQPSDERIKMLAGYITAASMTHDDPLVRSLLVKFHTKEYNKYGNSRPQPRPPSVA